MFNYASKIITMSSFLAEHYQKKYALKCETLHPLNVDPDRERSGDVDRES